MWTAEVHTPSRTSLRRVQRGIEMVCAREGLVVAREGTLAMYPGSIHWHLRRPAVAGTLEVTFWPEQCRVWVSVQHQRAAPWTRAAARAVKKHLEEKLRTT